MAIESGSVKGGDLGNAAFALKHIAKDLRLAKDLGLATPLGEVAFKTFQQAEPALGEQDIISVIKQIKKQ